MKQQCHIAFVYGSWFILAVGFFFYLINGGILNAILWVCFAGFFLWLYVRNFPSLARFMGYGSVGDQAAADAPRSAAEVTFYTGLGCPFCPIVRQRLHNLQSQMGFRLIEKDVTLKPDILIAKGIRALPVIEVGPGRWVGNATSQQLAEFITTQGSPVRHS